MTDPRALVVLQARTGSTRLPGKVLAGVNGISLIERCIRRLQAAAVGPVVVATTWLAADQPVAAVAAAADARVVRGSPEDVLDRYVQAVRDSDAPYVIRATADNPLVDIEACRRVLQHLVEGADYVVEKGLPVGTAVEGMTTAALREAGRVATAAYDREHVTPWLRRCAGSLIVSEPWAPAALVRWDLRFTVDTVTDLQYVNTVVAEAGRHVLLPLAAYIEAADRLASCGGRRAEGR